MTPGYFLLQLKGTLLGVGLKRSKIHQVIQNGQMFLGKEEEKTHGRSQ